MKRTNHAGRIPLREGVLLATMLGFLVLVVLASVAFAQEAPGTGSPELLGISPKMIEEANESAAAGVAFPEVDTKAAAELPHTELGPSQAQHLLTAVFGDAVESPAGIFDEVPEGKFIGTNAEIMSPEALGELAEEDHSATSASGPAGPALIESMLPLRVEDEAGKQEPVDLSLENAEGELQEENPIVPVGIPAELGEGVELAEGKIGISFPGGAQGREPSTIEGDSAFYPNVEQDTDLVVAPMPTGVETLTQIRSPEAPDTQVESLSLPTGASLTSSEDGGAKVTIEGHQLLEVTPATAIDAAGNSVPTEMTVSGSELRITVSPVPGTAYPILVDPNFRLDERNWTWGGSNFAGWQPVDSASGYTATENAGTYSALDLKSGFNGGSASANTGAQWVYLVPRFSSDQSKYGAYPTSWIEYVSIGGMMYLYNYAGSTWPEIVSGILDPIHGGWVSTPWSWSGASGEITGWSGSFAVTGGSSAGKEFAFGLITIENETSARMREAVAADSVIELRDEDTPILTVSPTSPLPTGWVKGGEYSLTYSAQDTGLGVAGLKTELEGQPSSIHTFALSCSGTNQAPCPRVAKSSEGGMPTVKINAAEEPTGNDHFLVSAYDPLYGYESGGTDKVAHIATASESLPLKIDHTAPEITLSGALAEQEGEGPPLTGEYPLEIGVTDGSNEAEQSGVATVEVKVDGKKVTMPKEAAWKPECKTQDCSFSGSWTLKSSEYAAGTHEVEVLATDALGNVSKSNIEVETGLEPLKVKFTSPHSSYTNGKISQVSFLATREGKPVEGATFKCSFDGSALAPCSSPYTLPDHLAANMLHTLGVVAKEPSGSEEQGAFWSFRTGDYPAAPASEKLVYPEEGKKTASYFTLEAEWPGKAASAEEEVSGVTFQMKLPGQPLFEPVPTECVINSKGGSVSWPLHVSVKPDRSPPVYMKVKGCPAFVEAKYPEKEIQFRAVFDGGPKAAGASSIVNTEFVYSGNQARVATDATEAIGPGTVDLLTGAYSMSATDVSIPVPGYETNLEFTRTYSSTMEHKIPNYKTVLGGAWQPSLPLESESEGEAWTSIQEKFVEPHGEVTNDECWGPEEEEVSCPEKHCTITRCEEWVEEEAQPEEHWLELIDNEGASVPVELVGGIGGTLVLPEWAKEIKLTWEGAERIDLSYPNGSKTIFAYQSGPANERTFAPREFSFQASPSSDDMVYVKGTGSGTLVLKKEIAPAPVGVTCSVNEAMEKPGCRMLEFVYEVVRPEKQEKGEVLRSINYYNASGNPSTVQTVASYAYNSNFELTEEWDPRLPGLKTRYAYQAGTDPAVDQMTSVTPPGEEPWTFRWWEHKGEEGAGEEPLESVSRGGATTTIAYGVPVSGAGAPYNMSATEIARWGQGDLPVDATAIFPPTATPSSYPTSTYSGATIHYLDPDGSQVNVASPSPPGVEGTSISTTETNQKGDVIRELTPQNRLRALQATNPAQRSRELDSHSVYNAEGTEMLESWGPLHEVRLEDGETGVSARQHTTTHYDEGEPTPAAGIPPAYLPTKETVAAIVPGREGEVEPRTTETKYNWTFRLPEETIVDPGGLAIRTVTKYNSLGQVIETTQPKGAAGGTPGDTKTVYYSAEGGNGECNENKQYANLPCEMLPAKQAVGTGRHELDVTKYTAYNALGEATEVLESPGGEAANVRKTITTYDAAGRQLTTKTEGGGTSVPESQTLYSSTSGMPVRQQFLCGTECASYSSSFGTSGSGELKRPMGIAVDASGNVYVTDRELNCVKKFGPSGTYLSVIGKCGPAGGSGNGEFKEPRSIAIDPAGHIWVADQGNSRIEEFSAGGAYMQTLGGSGESGGNHLSAPYGVAVDGEGRVWVADAGKIVEFKETTPGVYPYYGTLTSIEGSASVQAGQITVDATGDVWIVENAENRISELEKTPSGFVGHHVFGGGGSGPGQLNDPLDIKVMPSGNLLVVDRGNNRLEEFSKGGIYQGTIGAVGTGSGQFTEPTAIAFGPGGVFYVTDSGDHRVEKWQVGAGARATSTTYNSLGEATEYEDADGAVTKMTYDAFGRPATVTDPRGTKTFHYDGTSGVLTSMEVSGVGTFTAAYDADGDLISRGLPDGLTATTTFNQADEPTKLMYTKTSSCSGSECTWFEETLERSPLGKIVAQRSTLEKSLYSYLYSYDKAGRLIESQETEAGGKCTGREYKYDADSNRLSKTTRTGKSGLCPTSEGAVEEYGYDEADRLIGPTYDAWGRITTLPGQFAGGNELETKYFANNMVAEQKQNGVTNTFQLDATGRQRQREQTGGVAGTEIFHYDGPGDSPSWTALGSTWSRNISGIGGELAAVQESTGTVTFKLTDLHGDVVASASSNSAAGALLATSRFDEFGEPASGSPGRFGWLGGKFRRTELASGVIQMGARSYIPQLGRFLTPDPVYGGSANAYDYADQDPVNIFDLAGKQAREMGGSVHKHKHALLRSHTIRAVAKDGVVHVLFHFAAKEKVTVHMQFTFRGSTSPIEHTTGTNSSIGASTAYSGTAINGESASVCAVVGGSSKSESHCYKVTVTVEPDHKPQPAPAPEPEPGFEIPLIPMPITEEFGEVVEAI